MRHLLAAIRPESDREATLMAGLSLLGLGLFFAWPPAALIVPGAILTLVGVFSRDPA